jgi:hypothetical protein
MRIKILICVLLTAMYATAGMYYLADADGNVRRVKGETPYPEGAIVAKQFDGAQVSTLIYKDGKLRLKTVAEFNAMTSKEYIKEADYDNWTKREKALCRLFVKEINKLRVKNGDAPYTVAQVKAALKAEME